MVMCLRLSFVLALGFRGLSACEKNGQWRLLLVVLFEMAAMSFEPALFSYIEAMAACDRSVHWLRALVLLRHLPAVGVAPDAVSASSGASACEDGGQWRSALEILRTALCSSDRFELTNPSAPIPPVLQIVPKADGALHTPLSRGHDADRENR